MTTNNNFKLKIYVFKSEQYLTLTMEFTLMNNNDVIQSLWIGKSISPMEKLCMASFLKNGHDFHLYVYEDIIDPPEGVTIFDANGILPYPQYFMDSNKSPASFADWFRYKLLFEKGGWWVDMDSICLKKFDFKDDYCFSTEYCSSEGGHCINNSPIKSPAKAGFLQEILTYISKIEDRSNIQWGEFGPILLKLILKTYDSSAFIKPPVYFCPLIWSDVDLLISANNDFHIPEESYAIHLWNTRWKIEGYDKNGIFPNDCLYEKLKRRYNIS